MRRSLAFGSFVAFAPLAFGSLLLGACAEDADHLYRCEDTRPALDVAAVSVLEDSASIAEMHDALEVDVPMAEGAMTTSRKLTAIEVLVAIPASLFDSFPDGNALEVEVFDAPKPMGTPVVVRQTLVKSALTWEDTTITSGQSTHEQAHKTAWWRFELPNGGLAITSDVVMAGVIWPEQVVDSTLYFGAPAGIPIGYSNYDRPCAKNWSIYPDWRTAGSNIPPWTWVENGASAETQAQGANACSWPMLKVEMKTEHLSTSACPR